MSSGVVARFASICAFCTDLWPIQVNATLAVGNWIGNCQNELERGTRCRNETYCYKTKSTR